MRWFLAFAAWAGHLVAAEPPRSGSAPPEPVSARFQLHVLPLAFSAESEKNYGAWLQRLKTEGLGNAIWQELEELFFAHPRYAVVQSPLAQEEFLRIVAARSAAAPDSAGESLYELPDKVITVNANFFTRANPGIAWGKGAKQDEFHVTVYLRYYDLAGRRLNVPVPAQADAVAGSPIIASRQALRAAFVRLFQRLEPPKATSAPGRK